MSDPSDRDERHRQPDAVAATALQPAKLSAPAYERAYHAFFRRAMDGLLAADELLGDIDKVVSRHEGPLRNVRGSTPLDQPMQSASAPASLTIDAIRQTDLDAHAVMVFETSQTMIAEQSKGFLANLSAVSAAAGTTVSSQGDGAPSIEQMREMLRVMDLEFDEDGNLSENIRIIVAPEAADVAKALIAAAQEDPECIRIVLDKREKWLAAHASQRTRKLR